jgi:hypothetical protein
MPWAVSTVTEMDPCLGAGGRPRLNPRKPNPSLPILRALVRVVADGVAGGVAGLRLAGSWPLYGGSVTAAVTFTSGSGSTPAPEGVPF